MLILRVANYKNLYIMLIRNKQTCKYIRVLYVILENNVHRINLNYIFDKYFQVFDVAQICSRNNLAG